MSLKNPPSPTGETAPPKTRRRGEALERALLDAAWDELLERGFDGLTYEGVAGRAGTSRAVLYRRWPAKGELAIAAIRHARMLSIGPSPDTGSLRGDLKAVLQQANDTKFTIGLMLMTQLGAFYTETGRSPEDLRSTIIADGPRRTEQIWERAIARGEVDPARLTPRVQRLYFDLFRDQLFMTLKPVPDADIDAILDEVVLPLVRPRA